jgi:Raf kinase inhibitor-like YbhB/YbcL family protein
MWLKSDAFLIGGALPKRHTHLGEHISPSLRWGDIPDTALELIVVMEDLDTTPIPTVHWLVYKISGDEPGLPEALPKQGKLEDPSGALQGKNSFGAIGYQGPTIEKGAKAHRLRITLYAIKKELDVPAELRREALERVIQNQVVDQVSIECLSA